MSPPRQTYSVALTSCLLLSFQPVQPFSSRQSLRSSVGVLSPSSRSRGWNYKTLKRKRQDALTMTGDSSLVRDEVFESADEVNGQDTQPMLISSLSPDNGGQVVASEHLLDSGKIVADLMKEAVTNQDMSVFQNGRPLGDGDVELSEDAIPLETPSEPVGVDVEAFLFGSGSDESLSTTEQSTGSTAAGVNLTEFLLGQGEATAGGEIATLEEEQAENVGAVLAAAAAAEASISSDVADSIPLIPNLPSNGTLGTAKEMPSIVSAPSVVGEPDATIAAPNVKKILTFAVPAIGVWLCSPLLSLIDTSAVGLLSGTTQQAALNPAVAVTDYAALLIAFMYTATTNLVAAAQETDRGVEGKPRTTKSLVSSLQLSGFVGLGLGTVLLVFARQLLRAIIGNDGISPKVFAAAMKYVRIRALGMPAAAILGSAQAACLGMQDIHSPLYVLAAAAVVNFFGDMIFVGSSNPLIGGAAGAAWATVFSQYAALAMFLRWLCHKPRRPESPKVVNISNAILELTGKPEDKGAGRRRSFTKALRSLHLPSLRKPPSSGDASAKRHGFSMKLRSATALFRSEGEKKTVRKEAKKENESFSVRGFLEGRFRRRDLLSLPSKDAMSEFAPYVIPVTTTQVGRVSSYVAMSHVVSSSLGTISMAAQQVIVSLFYCLCPIADSLSLTAQSFVPTIAEKKISRQRANALRETAFNFMKAGAVFSAVMVGAVGCIPLLSKFFTSDPWVVALVNSVTPLLMGVFAVHGTLCATEGVLLGQKDLGFLGKSYAAYFAAVPWLLLRVKKAALAGDPSVNLASVWKVFLSYQLFRFCAWMGRVMMLQSRTDREAGDAST